jgi:transposase
MSQSRTRFIGMDGHKESIAVAYVAQDHGAEVTSLGTIGTRQCDIDQLLRKRHSKATHLVFVYEAGPWGSWLSRSRTKKGQVCWVVAPSLIPKQAGDRVKTDRRAAVPLARLMRSGDLPPVSVPAVEAAALRALSRTREAVLRDLQTATLRLQALLLRPDLRSTGPAPWGPAPLRWRRAVGCPPPAPQIVCHASGRTVPEPTARLPRLAPARKAQGPTWRRAPGVEACQALRGVQCPVAVTTVAALGALSRCAPPRPLLRALGRTPSAYARGARRRHGGIPKTGHAHARRARREGAWAARSPAQGSRPLPRRLEQRLTPMQDRSWQAQGRLGNRSRPRTARGNTPHAVVVASARDVVAFLGAIAPAVPVTAESPHLFCTRHRCRLIPQLRGRPVFPGPRQRRSPGMVESSSACRG